MVVFISGHRDLTQEEFNSWYVPKLEKYKKLGYKFVVGDYQGCDYMAQIWLRDNIEPERVTVYHMFTAPRNLASKEFALSGGYTSDVARDSEMTRVSDIDLAYIRKGRWTSGTAQNILRRYEK